VNRGLVRVGPVYFQGLEQELAPVASYLAGHLLDAGCGSRDISASLHRGGVRRITRYDLESDEPGVVIGPLEEMPFEEATFDSALCNAVLEHVADAERSIREIARVVRPGGHIVVAVPFLQPYHPCPGDFRRYTADGLAQLGRGAGLEVVAVLPVHSFAQTIGWLVWAYAEEKGGRARRAAAWALAAAVSRASYRTDGRLRRNANTFQAVYRRPLTGGREAIGAWQEHELPEQLAIPPTMLTPDEVRLLHHLADERYAGEGCIVDCGSFLGGSTVALADGLRRNLARRGRPEEPLIHAFDRFEVEEYTRGVFFPATTRPGTSFRARFDGAVAPYAGLVEVHGGDIEQQRWTGGPIEILFVDVAKHWTTCDWVTRELFGHLIPGRSIVVQQDYLYDTWTAWLHVTMEYYAEYFEYVCDTGVNSVVFRHTKAIPPEVLQTHTVARLSRDEKVALMDRAAGRFPPAQRELLRSAKRQFLEMLDAA
jgi:SAM-dependent methyltransferase